jgi:hypothetical protein
MYEMDQTIMGFRSFAKARLNILQADRAWKECTNTSASSEFVATKTLVEQRRFRRGVVVRCDVE